jgi:NAD(P)-dependent dehydrogenase (short-subunit alcohol dehydrogenase family)
VSSHFLRLDLGDLNQIDLCVDEIAERNRGKLLEIVVANAGLWPTRYAQSAQGHELAFATNVLGHHALLRRLEERNLLAPRARIIIVTGDIYIMARDCSPDFSFIGSDGCQRAYCRSKLGNLWMMYEWARRHPELRVHAVHPGVIASELGGGGSGLAGALKRALLLSARAGAQTSLFCATQPGLRSGTYYHNTLGCMELREDDPAMDSERAARFWDTLEHLYTTR